MKSYLVLLSRIGLLNFFVAFTVVVFFYFQTGGPQDIDVQQGSAISEPEIEILDEGEEMVDREEVSEEDDSSYIVVSEEDLQEMLNEVAPHNTPDDCWVIFDDHIYSLTTYFDQHPEDVESGGQYCGSEGSRILRAKITEGVLDNYLVR
jgi:hypothetical protein